MKRFATIVPVLFLAACGSASVTDAAEDDLATANEIGPQSLSHGTLSSSQPEVGFKFHGVAGDVIAPDVRPTGKSAAKPTLTLYGPRHVQLATGSPRGADPRQRVFGTAATVVWSLTNGAAIVRVHDVGPIVQVVRMIRAILERKPRISPKV